MRKKTRDKIKFDNRTIEAIKVNDLEFTYVAKDGSVKAKREMMYVYDLADSIFFILEKLLKNIKKLKKIIKKTSFINVGTGTEHPDKFYVDKIQSIVNPAAKIKYNKK